MKRPIFLGNKVVTCDFCKETFLGNLNQANIIMCDKCVRDLSNWTERQKVEFLNKFSGDRNREKVIKRFINEEVEKDGAETEVYRKRIIRSNDASRFFRLATTKIWKKPSHFKLGKART